jgi:hypothetical protein
VSAVRLQGPVAAALALGALACSSGAAGPVPGFTTAYAPPGVVNGTQSGADGGTQPGTDGGAPAVFRSVRGSGSGSGWAVGDDGMAVHLLGNAWTPTDSGSTATLGGLFVPLVGMAFAVELGGPRVLAWNGASWSPLGGDRADRAAAATWGIAPNDVWVAGNGIEHWDGQTWTMAVPAGATFTSMAGSFANDVWAAGPGGVQHWNGKVWTPQEVPANLGTLAAVWASEVYDVWFVGAKGAIAHWGGTGISSLSSQTTEDLTCVSGTAPDDVWMGGTNGTLVHWNGTFWSVSQTPAGQGHTINDIWRVLDVGVFYVDDTGVVTKFVP